MTLAQIRSAKEEGFYFAQEVMAREGKEFALAMFRKSTASLANDNPGIPYWGGFLNGCVGMSAHDNHGYTA